MYFCVYPSLCRRKHEAGVTGGRILYFSDVPLGKMKHSILIPVPFLCRHRRGLFFLSDLSVQKHFHYSRVQQHSHWLTYSLVTIAAFFVFTFWSCIFEFNVRVIFAFRRKDELFVVLCPTFVRKNVRENKYISMKSNLFCCGGFRNLSSTEMVCLPFLFEMF